MLAQQLSKGSAPAGGPHFIWWAHFWELGQPCGCPAPGPEGALRCCALRPLWWLPFSPGPCTAALPSLTGLGERPAGIQPLSAACPWHHERINTVGLIDAPYNYMHVLAGGLQIPQETLYKKNVLLMRGRFRPFTLLHNDMLQGSCSTHGSITLWKCFVEGIKITYVMPSIWRVTLICSLIPFWLPTGSSWHVQWVLSLAAGCKHMSAVVRDLGASAGQWRLQCLPAGAASQFFCEVPSQSGTSGQLGMAGDTYDECVYREDTLVLLELTTRDMMEASNSHDVHTLLFMPGSTTLMQQRSSYRQEGRCLEALQLARVMHACELSYW